MTGRAEEGGHTFWSETATSVGRDVVHEDLYAFPSSAFCVALGVDADGALKLVATGKRMHTIMPRGQRLVRGRDKRHT